MYAMFFVLTVSVGADFAETLTAKFEEQYQHNPAAYIVGSGEVTLIDSGLEPLTNRCEQEVGSSSTISAEEAVRLYGEVDTSKCNKVEGVQWFAWVTPQGKLHVAYNHSWGEYEKSLIWLIGDGDEHRWTAWGTYFVNSESQTWLKGGKYTLLSLGHVSSAAEAQDKLQMLEKLRLSAI